MTEVISENWGQWSDRKPLADSPIHNKLSSRTPKTPEDILMSAQKRRQAAEANQEALASQRADKLQAERDHEAAVRQRHDDAIKAIGETTERKQQHAEAARLAKLQEQTDRLKRDAERAEAVRQRKLANPSSPEGAAGASTDRGVVIDLPWTMFGESEASTCTRHDALTQTNM